MGPCTHIVYTLAPKYPNRDYFKAKVYAVWVHGPLGDMNIEPAVICRSHEGERPSAAFLLPAVALIPEAVVELPKPFDINEDLYLGIIVNLTPRVLCTVMGGMHT